MISVALRAASSRLLRTARWVAAVSTKATWKLCSVRFPGVGAYPATRVRAESATATSGATSTPAAKGPAASVTGPRHRPSGRRLPPPSRRQRHRPAPPPERQAIHRAALRARYGVLAPRDEPPLREERDAGDEHEQQ